jgi:ribosomal protein S26
MSKLIEGSIPAIQCQQCEKIIPNAPINTKWCDKCKKDVIKEKRAIRDAKEKKELEKLKEERKNKSINSFYLVRGKIR